MVHSVPPASDLPANPSDRATLGRRLAAARREQFVGREAELRLLQTALSNPHSSFAVLHIHGPAGVGKTALLAAYADLATRHGAKPVSVDGRDVNGSPAQFDAALRRALGLPEDAAPLPALVTDPRPVLLFDTYEVMLPLDDWVRECLLPQLPAHALVVMAGREPPTAGWRSDAGWGTLLRTVALSNLSGTDSRALLRARGVPEAMHERVVAFSHGHPLALSLVGDLLRQYTPPEDSPTWTSGMPDVVRLLLDRFLSTVPGPRHRQALEVCARVRITTEDLLRAGLDVADASDVFSWMRGLSFIEQGPFGLFPHDLVREVLDSDLRWRDHDAYATLNERVRRHLMQQLRRASHGEQQRVTLDLFYLQRDNPLFTSHVDFGDHGTVWQDTLRPDDAAEIRRLVTQTEGAGSAEIAAFWLDRQPEAFRVYRRPANDQPVAVMTWLRLADPNEEEIATDPVLAAAWRHTRQANPVRPGEYVAIARFVIDPACYQRPSPVMTLMQSYVVMRALVDDALAWSFVVVADRQFWSSHMSYVHMPFATDAEVAGRSCALFGHDWRVTPPDAWIALLERRMVNRTFDPDVAVKLEPAVRVLSEADFADAVRAALRNLRRPARLAGNPLLESRLVRERSRNDEPANVLVDLISEAVDALRVDSAGEKAYRAVDRTFVRPAATQERAAEVLGVPFSTYRRHLARGVEQVTAWLWERELYRPML